LPGEDVPTFLDRTGRRAVQEQITSEKDRVR
jgi:hypothetical protein